MRRAALLAAAMLMAVCAGPVLAQTPLRIVVPVPPGGGIDMVARLLATHLTIIRGETVVVENRPGGDAMIGVQHVASASPDGKTVLLGASFLATNTVLHRFNFDPKSDLVPVIMTSRNETVLAVNAALDIGSVSDFVALAQRRPEGLNCAAVAGHPAMACDQLRALLNGKVTSIPYSGLGPATNALAAGVVDFMVSPRAALASVVDAGKVKFIAGVDPHRMTAPWEKLPLLQETWPAMYTINFNGIFVPVGTPASIVQSLNADFNRVLALPEVSSVLQRAGHHVVGGSPETLRKALSDTIAHMRRVADQSGIQPN